MNKKIIKIIFIILISIVAIIGIIKLYQYIRIKTAKIEIVLKSDLNLEFNDKKRVGDYIDSINGKIVNKNIEFEFVNDDGIKLKYNYNINVVDTVSPLIWLGNSYTVKKDSDINLEDKILCGDNYDANPKCYIEGNYDLKTAGNYQLTFKAIDNSGNENSQDFTLKVYEPTPNSGGNTNSGETSYIAFNDIVRDYKKESTKIGIDVSKWQGDIDFKKLKEAGVEFIMIRIGGTRGKNGKYFVDEKFKYNIEMAKKYNIKAGVYFYSYADSIETARKDAKWVLKQIKKYKVDMPIAFDWEEWSSFNDYNLSFFGLTSMAEEFIKVIENNGYKGMIYSSKTYLENVWLPTKYDIWLAHYTNKTNYNGKYKLWQICSDGKVDGIDTMVDIDIMYE